MSGTNKELHETAEHRYQQLLRKDPDGRYLLAQAYRELLAGGPTIAQAREAVARMLCCHEWSDEGAWEYHNKAGHDKWRDLADQVIRIVKGVSTP